MTREILGTTCIVVAASVLSSFVTATMLAPRERTGAVAPSTARPEVDGGWDEVLARLERALERDALVGQPAERAAVPVREPAEDDPGAAEGVDSAEWMRILANIDRKLDRRPVIVGADSAPALPLDRPTDAAAVSDMVALDAVQPGGVFAECRMLTATQVLERFGAPAVLGPASGGTYDTWWRWDEPHEGAMEMYFIGSYVLHARARGQ